MEHGPEGTKRQWRKSCGSGFTRRRLRRRSSEREKPWQSWDEAVQRTAGQAAVHYGGGAGAVRAVRRGSAKCLNGEKQPWPGLGSVAGAGARRAERPRAAQPENLPSGAGRKMPLHRGKAAVAGFGGSVAGAGAPGERTPGRRCRRTCRPARGSA